MRKIALPAEEMYARDLEAARKTGGKLPCRKCSGTGYFLTDNVAKFCDCRLSAMRATRERQQEQRTPNKDIASILFNDPDGAA
jgi:hypothetical protein